jgi:Trypsin-like serine proteases, typically periplasmic, contain C-terminal PDZ domain
MKQITRQIAFMLAAVALAAPVMSWGQDKKADKEKKEAEQIIITRTGDSDKKIVIEVTGDKVTVNGKDLKDAEKDGNISVRRSKIKDVWAFGGDGFTTTIPRAGGLRMFDMSENRAMLGVTTEQAEGGVEVQAVTEGSAAEKAGLKKGDIIKTVDDKKIETPDDLSKAIRDHKPGDKVSISFMRDKKQQKVTAELGKWQGASVFNYSPDQNFNFDMDLKGLAPQLRELTMAPGRVYTWSGGGPKLGLSVQETEDGKGLKVIDVDEDGNAAKAGIKEDDVITEVDGSAVNSTDEITRQLRSARDKSSFKLKLLRNGKTETVDVKIPRKLKKADL